MGDKNKPRYHAPLSKHSAKRLESKFESEGLLKRWWQKREHQRMLEEERKKAREETS